MNITLKSYQRPLVHALNVAATVAFFSGIEFGLAPKGQREEFFPLLLAPVAALLLNNGLALGMSDGKSRQLCLQWGLVQAFSIGMLLLWWIGESYR